MYFEEGKFFIFFFKLGSLENVFLFSECLIYFFLIFVIFGILVGEFLVKIF